MYSELCAQAPPAQLASDPDISGIGVTIAYTSTAAIALILVILNYIFVYHPDAVSAAEQGGLKHQHPSKINPIDEYLLYWRLGTKREIRGIERWGEKGLRVKNALTYAMLTMSDFQLITGMSILISGFTQLDTGISAYHWQRLVWWLIISFTWGILNLWMRPVLEEEGRDTWTFGQVMAFLVVFAPLITLVEGYVKATMQHSGTEDPMMDVVDGIEFIQVDSRAPSSLIGLVAKSTPSEDDFINPHPAHDYYKDRFSFPILVYAALVNLAVTSCLLLYSLKVSEVRPSDIIRPYETDSTFMLAPPIPVLVGYLACYPTLEPLPGLVRPVRIAGGFNATKGEFPYAVSLQMHNQHGNLFHFCTGSLLDARTVLTAAHCVLPVVYTERIDPEDMVVRIGSLSTSSGGFLANVSSLVAHPYYDPYQVDWDVGIVKLSQPVPYSDIIEFAKLARHGSDPYEGAFANVAGWGQTSDRNKESDTLRHVLLPIVSRANCARAYATFDEDYRGPPITTRMICAGYRRDGDSDEVEYVNEESVCHGDSGGPLVDEETKAVIGITSWGLAGCGSTADGAPNVFSRVEALRGFIDEHMEASKHH
ncbi:hypothetical protein E8E13_001084 [Curvularia kusanoi]|uniref:Peptidase S1 domain-containing protein n=1 Tax=Curvularia kusanoi TaxID=90978 RepID=A0A9P4TF77_CURKU|nr:hypothetical protein E8E13_001084 [Curvularia kusanoi]